MRLYELAWACDVYGVLTGYDVQLRRLRATVDPVLDPDRSEHRVALFKWLNSWGCRQFKKDEHATTASRSLSDWALRWLSSLPRPDAELTEVADPQIDAAADAFVDLTWRVASHRRLKSGHLTEVSFGSTGAAKVLFALRPLALPPWDGPIRGQQPPSDDANDYRAYLRSVTSSLRDLAAEAGAPVRELPNLVGRPHSTPAKLVDEYNWVVITRGGRPPTPDALGQWLTWADAPVAGIGH